MLIDCQCEIEDWSTGNPNSRNIFLVHLITFLASTAVTNSASVVGRVMNDCNQLLQSTAPPPMHVTYPPVERLLSLFPL